MVEVNVETSDAVVLNAEALAPCCFCDRTLAFNLVPSAYGRCECGAHFGFDVVGDALAVVFVKPA